MKLTKEKLIDIINKNCINRKNMPDESFFAQIISDKDIHDSTLVGEDSITELSQKESISLRQSSNSEEQNPNLLMLASVISEEEKDGSLNTLEQYSSVVTKKGSRGEILEDVGFFANSEKEESSLCDSLSRSKKQKTCTDEVVDKSEKVAILSSPESKESKNKKARTK